MGISKRQSARAQKLAEVPEPEFETAMNRPGVKPTSREIVNQHRISKMPPPPPKVDPLALWLWGHLSKRIRRWNQR